MAEEKRDNFRHYAGTFALGFFGMLIGSLASYYAMKPRDDPQKPDSYADRIARYVFDLVDQKLQQAGYYRRREDI